MPSKLGLLAIQAGATLYGLVCLAILCIRLTWNSKRPKPIFWDLVAEEQTRYWDLAQTPDGFAHHFHQVPSGVVLHYVTDDTAPSSTSKKSEDLVIAIHGWPDSWMLWREVWRSVNNEVSHRTNFVAVDLPGFGGSDVCDDYGPDTILESIAQFIVAMREKYLGENGKVIVITHDWGALVGFRLASEAPQLADRFILANAGLPVMILARVRQRIAIANRMFSMWFREPTKVKFLKTAFVTLGPPLSQLWNSMYVGIFNLPDPLPRAFIGFGDKAFVRFANGLGSGDRHVHDSVDAAKVMVSSMGPSESVLKTRTSEGETYPTSLQVRGKLGALSDNIRIYREHVTVKKWRKSLDLIASLHHLEEANAGGSKRRRSSGGALFRDGPKGAMGTPTTVLFGLDDPALNSTLMLDGLKDYMANDSQVIVLPGVGHWVPTDGEGTAAMAESLTWALDGQSGSLEERVGRVCKGAKLTASK